MKGEQMDLFATVLIAEAPPATARIIAFPVDRERLFIRQTAIQVRRREGPARLKFWKTEKNRLYGRLQVRGLPDAEIRAEIERFAYAVHAEMQRIDIAEATAFNPPGAA